MEQAEIIRTLDELGRVVLPKALREALGWKEKTKLTVMLNEKSRELTLREYTPEES